MAAYTTIDDPSAYFKVQLYTGNGGTNAITFDDTDTNMQPDIVWLKNRNSSGHDHFLFNVLEVKLHSSSREIKRCPCLFIG